MTQIVHNPTSRITAPSSSSSTFFANSGAVAGTFVAAGLAITAGVLAFVIFMLRRRRRQRLDRDVAAAATAAAAAAHHSRHTFDDDEEQPSMAQYGGYYAASTPGVDVHGQPQPPMGGYEYEDPTGGYDAYASNLASGDRSSVATAAGMAGFGAQAAQQDFSHQPVYDEQYETLAQPDFSGERAEAGGEGYYFDPRQAYDYAGEDAYGGYDGEHGHLAGIPRPASAGSIAPVGGGDTRGLKVTNV